MNLLQASYYKVQADIHAGGPGSGRRPGGGSSSEQANRRALIKHGFKTGAIQKSYKHQDVPGSIYLRGKDGNWEHMYGGNKIGSGEDTNTLKDHLENKRWKTRF